LRGQTIIGKVTERRRTSARPGDVWTGARSAQSMLNDEIWKYDVGEEVWMGNDGDEI
jgi:hypothetical protein